MTMNPSFPARNKYLIVTLAFVVWVGFFDRNDLITQIHLRADLRDLQQKKAYYQQQIALTCKERKTLISSPLQLEKFAREHFLMKKDQEDLFLIRYPDQKNP